MPNITETPTEYRDNQATYVRQVDGWVREKRIIAEGARRAAINAFQTYERLNEIAIAAERELGDMESEREGASERLEAAEEAILPARRTFRVSLADLRYFSGGPGAGSWTGGIIVLARDESEAREVGVAAYASEHDIARDEIGVVEVEVER